MSRPGAMLAAMLFAATWVAGCHRDGGAPPAMLRVSAIPDQAADNVKAQHWPVVQLVCAAVDVKCEWVALDTYEAVVEAVGRGEVDVAFLGGATYWHAHDEYGVAPLAIRDIDTRFTSTVVVRSDASARTLKDLAGGRFAFGNRASTSGHVMARHFLVRDGVEPERFFSKVEYMPHHDATLAAIYSGRVDAGVVNSSIAHRALARGGRYDGALRVVWESPTYVDYVWAANPRLPRGFQVALREAFLDLDRESPAQAPALRSEGAGGFLPPGDGDYSEVGEAVRAAGAIAP